MQKLFHLSTIPTHLDWFNHDWQLINQFVYTNGMDGIELGLTQDYDISKIPKDIVKGVHLSFYPMWLDFWNGETHEVIDELGSYEAMINYYGGEDRQALIDGYHRAYQRAKTVGAEYMVFHVSHVKTKDTFTFTYDYTDEMVMRACIELVNAAFPKETDGPLLLFENLWWPGLNYLDAELTKFFIDQIEYPNKGYLVDISHLILTSREVQTEKQAYQYIKKVLKNLGETGEWIKGVHLNKTLPKHYYERDHLYTLQKYQSAENASHRNKLLRKHLQSLDPHKPFDHPIAAELLALINPKYCVYETAPQSRHELAFFIKKQHEALGIYQKGDA